MAPRSDALPTVDDTGAGSGASIWARPGTVLGGRFVVEGLLGSGGMGCVVRVRHLELGDLRAIKLLRPDRELSAEARLRLLREARAAARIGSAHVVRVLDVVSEGPAAPYLVMEYLEGETLAACLERGPLDAATATRIVVETCDALAEAHRGGTVHRDLKPSNVFLTSVGGRDGFTKVLDFGIAKTEESRLGDWTSSHALLASPAYASPEQLRASKDVDARSDIWSLGVILYESLSGQLPFGSGGLAELSSRVLRDRPVPLRKRRPDVPAELAAIVERCLEKQREARFEHVDALVEALAAFAPAAAAEVLARIRTLGPPAQHPPERVRVNVRSSVEASTLAQTPFAGEARAAARRRPARLAVALGALGAAMAVAVGAVVAVSAVRARDARTAAAAASARPAAPARAAAPAPAVRPALAPVAAATPGAQAARAAEAAQLAPPPPALAGAARDSRVSAQAQATAPAPRSRRDAARSRPARPAGARAAAPRAPKATAAGTPAGATVPVEELRLDDLIDERK